MNSTSGSLLFVTIADGMGPGRGLAAERAHILVSRVYQNGCHVGQVRVSSVERYGWMYNTGTSARFVCMKSRGFQTMFWSHLLTDGLRHVNLKLQG